MNPKVDFYFTKNERWKAEIALLRTIALGCGLEEVLKWGCPCYTYEDKNIVLIHVFKEYCAFLFFKGVLLKDAKGILVQQTAQVQQARQIRFTNTEEIEELKPVLKAYILEAIEVEKAGLKVELKKVTEYNIAEEFEEVLDENQELKTAFHALTPGRQRGYLLHFSAPKLSKTRKARVEQCIDKILEGKGLDD